MRRRPYQAAWVSEKTTGLCEVDGMTERGTTGAGEPQITRSSTTPQGGWTWHLWERHSPLSNQDLPQWNAPVDLTSNDPRQHGDGRGEVIPTCDGADFRQYERRVRLFVSNTRVAQREGLVNFWRDWKDVHSIRVKESRTWKLLMVFRICLIILRTQFKPIEVFRRGRIVDDVVYDFERQQGEDIRDYDTRFNILLSRFEAVAGHVNPLIEAHVFLRKTTLSAEKQSQIVCAAMSRYE